MSEEGVACKLGALYKHKERKPKKPHYIPRPWGKPYNYKCFQCPFTCMEKSHLYNHMKYSLCKNSLSLLVGSDWPYRKSDSERAVRPAERARAARPPGEIGQGDRARRGGRGRVARRRGPTCPEAQMGQTERPGRGQGRSWGRSRRVRPKGEDAAGHPASAIPCYPPPPGLRGYREAPALNLSALGVNYPGSHHSLLFSSYLSPAIAAHPTPAAPVAPLPFLASPARLAGPQPAPLPDRTPRDRPNSPEPGRLTRPASSPGCVSARKGSRNPECLQKGEGSNDSTVLIDDLCKVIHEYQEVEEQLCLMDNEDTPGQKQLRSQLTKIRKELLHIRQTLEKTTKQHEGPLDLSVKRSLDGIVKDHKSGGGGGGNLEGQDPPRPLVDQVQPSDGSKESRASRTALKYSAGTDDRSILDGRTRICEAEDLRASPEHGEGPAVKPSISEPPKSGPTDTALANRTTKCEADSSVPLGMDGRFGSSQPGLACPALEDDSKPPRSKSLKRSLSGDGQSERETGCRLSLLVGERLKQSRVV
uniref:Proline rich 35 n=1 Tax=Callorhinchus milii TaxID=7868 RepID=A0A4W3I5J1_CALMI